MTRLTWPILLVLLLAGCSSTPRPLEDPMASLRAPSEGPTIHRRAMAALDERAASSGTGETTPGTAAPGGMADGELAEEYRAALQRVIWLPGYTPEVRKEAFTRLEQVDPDGLKRTLRQQLPRMTAWQGLTLLCELIADRGWVELSPALISSWSRPTAHVPDDLDRPEYLALARLVGQDAVVDEVFRVFESSRKVSQQGLRTRAWELLERLGERERLLALLAEEPAEGAEPDLFLDDLRAGARDLGIVPHNREEILWLRKLRLPEHAGFWRDAQDAIDQLPSDLRLDLEMRDLAVVSAAARHRPDLIAASRDALASEAEERLRGLKRHTHGSNFDGFASARTGRLREVRDELTWGDLAAIHLALDALALAPVRAHLLDYAERDRRDETTEYGGVIRLDDEGRYEIREFVPRVRDHDRKFLASQAMMDAGYTALFHFHLHAQSHRNGEYAGPGFGDVNYADNTRANCLVLTFVREGVLNADYYRHGRVLVDLGEVAQP